MLTLLIFYFALDISCHKNIVRIKDAFFYSVKRNDYVYLIVYRMLHNKVRDFKLCFHIIIKSCNTYRGSSELKFRGYLKGFTLYASF